MELSKATKFSAVAAALLAGAWGGASLVTSVSPALAEVASQAASEPKVADTFHTYTLTGSTSCWTLVAPPAGKAAIVTQVRLDTYILPTPGQGVTVQLFLAPSGCTGNPVGAVTPGSFGQTVIPYTPGLAIPAGWALRAQNFNGVAHQILVDGYYVTAKTVPVPPGDARASNSSAESPTKLPR